MAGVQNKYVTNYHTSSATTHLQYYNPPSAVNQQQNEAPKTSYQTSTSLPSATVVTSASELSQDITNMLLKDQSNSDTKRVLQTSSVADYLSHLPTSLSLHHFLKYSADAAINVKKEGVVVGQTTQLNLIPSSSSIANIIQPIGQASSQTIIHNIQQSQPTTGTTSTTTTTSTLR